MTSAELLFSRDRCARLAHWSTRWQWPRLNHSEILRQAVEQGMTCDDPDPGQLSGDHVMALASERGMETPHPNLFELATSYAALADITVTAARREMGRLYRPQEAKLTPSVAWNPSSLLDANGTRLRRLLLVSRWSPERSQAEKHSYFSLFEVCAYEMPMTMTICVLGQNRDGRYHGPFSKAVQHPVNRALKFRRKGGQAFKGEWKQVWREELETPRETWLDAMERDGVLQQAMFEVEIPVPIAEIRQKITSLAAKRLQEIGETTEVPLPSPAMCFFPSRCAYADACWTFQTPSERLGYTQIS